VILLIIASLTAPSHPSAWLAVVPFAALTALGIRDLLQRRHTIQRLYPIIGHIRWAAEFVRPELRQYLFEADEEAAPFSRSQRTLVYERAKGDAGEHPFGTLLDVYRDGYEFIGHSIVPSKTADPATFRITIGGDQCARPYSASVFNISAMSFGALSANAIRALNAGARRGGFSHDTGEGGLSPYHLEMGGDIVWELGSGYFGCRTEDGHFDPDRFSANAAHDQVRMIEIKLSQGAKPGHGGVLPAAKVSPEIAQTRGVPVGRDCISPSRHTAFSNPLEMMAFIEHLRALSGGKPVGFKLCVGHPWEFLGVAKAMLETGITPDFIVVDGKEGGTGAAPSEFIDHMGMPLRDGLMFVHNALVGIGLRDKIRLGASGKIITAFDMARVMALGADWCNAARGFMFAVGCIQAQSCHTDRCPTGVTTQDKVRQRALVVRDKANRVFHFHKATIEALAELIAAAGLEHPDEIRPHHLLKRVAPDRVATYDQLYRFLTPGEILNGTDDARFRHVWPMARADSFAAAM
jgi:glutamate synthase domain-containing protein 2